ncbi:Winged helix DNA-binding domain superfamily [Arabidopsis thaliana x Arabidopsis arenosa]|uniref:Winged helix DNA-binding domain superfamily n=1 Tax=Arabidopsis thaliana x Arabidopsis arenosa TaxID=1240361 RepID=A0A8T1XFW7_9BRAS|nr:Winged helix DNA-binding domain superfamily [Arabidopsis thaliana x Arabidopsis arenosa]
METSRTVEHDVFIDFSSKDTRHSFVSHLHAAFRRQSISVFLAEHCAISEATLKPGFELANEIQLAIERSKVYVVVFSKNYASSPLCLETLVTFMDLQRRKDGPVVIPVFYGEVTRSIVEQQTERFKEDFSKHHGFFSDEKDRVERWRKGLTEAAKLYGHESIEQQNDSELVEDIVADVREKLCPTGMIGFYSRLPGIENLLFKQSHDIYRLGIWGMPGIGKTAIAQESFNQMTKHFETQCFIQDFHVAFNENGLYVLREEYLIDKLREKRVLVVLDDVRNPMDAESFLGGFDHCFGPESLMIITSRDKQVLHQCQVDSVYEIPALNKKEAQRLFTRFAFSEKEPSDTNLIEVSKKVVEYADGNPLALCHYGRELGKKKPEEVVAEFEKIKQSPPREIMHVFKSSYDELSENERSIFLDIAFFFNGENLDYVMRILEGCGFFPHVGIDRLVERSLLMISKNNNVEMQILIQDIARNIVNEEKNQITRHRRLWDPSIIKSFLEENKPKGTEVIEGIFLDTTKLTVDVNPKAFENMYNLRLLKIYSSNSESTQEFHLPKGLRSLPYELRLLHWEKYPLRSFPEDFDPRHLVELNMPYSQLQNLWEGTKSLVKLKIINLSHSQQLVEVDVLLKACSLEQIHLQGCTSLESFPHIDQLKNLQLLNLSGCTGLKRKEILEEIKRLDPEGALRETKFESMVFSTLVELEPEDNIESF